MEKEKKIDFKQFLSQFPLVDLPLILGEETHHTFSTKNKPIPQLMIEEYLLPLEDKEVDEFTEFVACFQLPPQKNYRAIVYWKAGLMSYQYTLATYGKDQKLIDKRVIAGTYHNGEHLTQSVATLQEDGQVIIASGQDEDGQGQFNAKQSTAYRLQISTKGKIINL